MVEKIVDSDSFEQYLISHPFAGKPENLYNAMNYIMQLGGKRMRPKFLLLAYKTFANEINEGALKLALAIETFHNFSLVHDDIMDNAPVRRGKKTVHEEWDTPTAILAGDNLVIMCYRLILESGFEQTLQLLSEFTSMSSEVCDGQQMDMNLPGLEHIDRDVYLKMIELKTAVLPACALKMGAIAANASKENADAFYEFGLNLGMAFQLQDDYLDCFGTVEQTGKQEGGDIIENKRTLLYLHAEKHLKGDDKAELLRWYSGPSHSEAFKVERVRELFKASGADKELMELKASYELKALSAINGIEIPEDIKKEFMVLFEMLKTRTS